MATRRRGAGAAAAAPVNQTTGGGRTRVEGSRPVGRVPDAGEGAEVRDGARVDRRRRAGHSVRQGRT